MTEKYAVEIVGTKALLLHNPTGLNSNRPNLRRGEHLAPIDEARSYLYLNADEKPCVPATNIKACIKAAGHNYKVAGRRSTFGAMIRAAIEVSPPMVPITSKKEWVVDTRIVAIQRARILRNRPKFEEWGLTFWVENGDPTIIHEDTLQRILIDAGKYYGLGDFRPEFGLFRIVSFTKA